MRGEGFDGRCVVEGVDGGHYFVRVYNDDVRGQSTVLVVIIGLISNTPMSNLGAERVT